MSDPDSVDSEQAPRRSDFIRDIIDEDLRSGKHTDVVTRFPPEPNGYLHIGHAKSICLNFGLALQYGGRCHLRMDDTDPAKEDVEFVEAIQADVRWLGFDWGDCMFYASDYFDALYAHAEQLIQDGKAYVDSLTDAEVKEYRGAINQPGKPSPYRDRSVEENLDLFRRMRAGEFADGAHVLRAKIDLAAANMKMRDPAIYRIRQVEHYRQGDKWCIYPLYDFTHCLSDERERITHSICTLEFENNRELYDWFLDNTHVTSHPQQIEFARLNLNYTVLSKRKLVALVEGGHVDGWDDPRMPTIAGLRRRGYTPEAIRTFCDRIGVAKNNSTVDVALLEHTVREDLNQRAPRILAVLDPLKVVLENYPDEAEEIAAPYFPPDIGKEGTRALPFSKVLYIEREDFAETPPKKWHRLAPGAEVRLRHAYVMRCREVVKDADGTIVELRCTVDLDTRDRPPADGRKVRGTIHWVSAEHALPAEARLYDRLFVDENPGRADDFLELLNPSSLVVTSRAFVEPSARSAKPGDHFQLERQGFFVVDDTSSADQLVFNRTVTLRDSWAKIVAKVAPAAREKRERKAPGPAAPRRAETELTPEAARYRDELGLSAEHARLIVGNSAAQKLFDDARRAHDNPKAIAAWVVNEALRELRHGDELKFGGAELGELVALVDDGTISGRMAKDVFAEMAKSGDAPKKIVDALGAQQIADASELDPIVDRVLASDPGAVERYKAGNAKVLGGLVGMVMRETKGKANPQLVNELVRKKLA